MTPVKWMPYVVIGGVVLVSLLAGFLVGWSDAWFIPVIVIPFALLYVAFDRQRAGREKVDRGG
jgi:hypothetical protein